LPTLQTDFLLVQQLEFLQKYCYQFTRKYKPLSERILMSDLLQQRHQIERRQPDKRRALYAVIDAEVIRDIDSLIPRSQRSKFLESVLRRELKELQAS